MTKPGSYKRVRRIPTEEDMNFIKAVARGEKKGVAFRNAYPNHPTVARYMDIKGKTYEGSLEEKKTIHATINKLARDKVQAKYINERLENFQDAMEVLAAKSIQVADEILEHGSSEKVRADLALEFIRHKVGTPVQKVQAQVEKSVTFSFGDAPEKIRGRDDMSDIIEAEIVND